MVNKLLLKFLVLDANKHRKKLMEIDDYMKSKTNMSYKEYSMLHYMEHRFIERIKYDDAEFKRLSKYE